MTLVVTNAKFSHDIHPGAIKEISYGSMVVLGHTISGGEEVTVEKIMKEQYRAKGKSLKAHSDLLSSVLRLGYEVANHAGIINGEQRRSAIVIIGDFARAGMYSSDSDELMSELEDSSSMSYCRVESFSYDPTGASYKVKLRYSFESGPMTLEAKFYYGNVERHLQSVLDELTQELALYAAAKKFHRQEEIQLSLFSLDGMSMKLINPSKDEESN